MRECRQRENIANFLRSVVIRHRSGAGREHPFTNKTQCYTATKIAGAIAAGLYFLIGDGRSGVRAAQSIGFGWLGKYPSARAKSILTSYVAKHISPFRRGLRQVRNKVAWFVGPAAANWAFGKVDNAIASLCGR